MYCHAERAERVNINFSKLIFQRLSEGQFVNCPNDMPLRVDRGLIRSYHSYFMYIAGQ